MTTRQHLLPINSTPFERTLSEAIDSTPEIGPAIETMRGVKYQRPMIESYAAWVLAQYGLGGISQFFDTIEEAVDAGIPWQRIRGTIAAMESALSWIDYDDIVLEHQTPWRTKWNRYQIAMGALPPLPTEVAHLLNAEYLAGISDPVRSVFRRGYHGYDVRALEASRRKWSGSIWSGSSGVSVPDGTARWSHGRPHELATTLSPETMAALRLDVENGDPVTWDDIPWSAPGRTWTEVVDADALRAYLFARTSMHLGFYRANGSLIGARRAVSMEKGTGFSFTVFFRTGFGDGAGEDVDTVRVLFNREGPASAPARLWLQPSEITLQAGDADTLRSNATPFDFLLGRTLRELISITITEA